jgi:hypothetical protein
MKVKNINLQILYILSLPCQLGGGIRKISSRFSFFTTFILITPFLFCCSCKKNVVTAHNIRFKVAHSTSNLTSFKVVHFSGGNYAVAAHDLVNHYTCHITGISETGDKLWEQQIPDSVLITDIAATADNGLIVCGYNNSNTNLLNESIFLSRYDAYGGQRWTTTFNAYAVKYLCMAIAPDGDIYLNSLSGLYGLQQADFLIRCSPAGQLIKTTPAVGLSPDSLICFPLSMIFSGNDIIVAGADSWWSTPSHSLIATVNYGDFCFRMDTGANIKWIFDQLDSLSISQSLISVNNGNNIAVIGSSTPDIMQPLHFDENSFNSDRGNLFADISGNFMVRFFDPNSGTMTVKQIQLPDVAEYPNITATSDNGYIISGCDNLGNNNNGIDTKILLAKTDNYLNVQWTKQLNMPYAANPFGIFQAADGGYIVFAGVQSFNNYKDIAFIKTDAKGNIK